MLPYIQIARIDHWFKNIFLIPGVFLAVYLDSSVLSWHLIFNVILALFITGLIASSNYVINEVLDAEKDKFHPVKKFRPVPSGKINIKLAYLLWIALAICGVLLSLYFQIGFILCAIALWVMGCLYNIAPIRTKEKPYLDVLSESVNNPLRLLLGWYATGIDIMPPISIILAYWMIGAFFMAAKRYGEFVKINDKEIASSYRKSFEYYTEHRLLTSIIYYATAFGLFFGIFIIRYRLELIMSIPFVAGFIAWYLKLTFLEDSPVQYPEKLYKEKSFILYLAFCTCVFVALLFIDIPIIGNTFVKTNFQ